MLLDSAIKFSTMEKVYAEDSFIHAAQRSKQEDRKTSILLSPVSSSIALEVVSFSKPSRAVCRSPSDKKIGNR